MEIVRDKKISRIVFLIAIALLITMCNLSNAQVVVIRDSVYSDVFKRTVIRKYPDRGIELKVSSENAYVSFRLDSVNNRTLGPAIFVYMPKDINLNGIDMVIHFNDGTRVTFKQKYKESLDDDFNYVEFHVNQETYPFLRDRIFNYIEFTTLGKYSNYQDYDFFTSFIKAAKG